MQARGAGVAQHHCVHGRCCGHEHAAADVGCHCHAQPTSPTAFAAARPPDVQPQWFCSLRSATTGNHYCGCSLIAPNAVLTAAQ